MNRRQDHSSLAAALQISVSIILVSISAILLATTFIAAPEALHPTEGNYEADGRNAPALPAPETVALPNTQLNPSLPVSTVILQPVTTTSINSVEGYIGFQGDFTFDETVCTFASPFVEPAGLTAAGWNVSGNILSGPGPVRTLRVSAFVNDGMTPLSGSGVLYNLRMVRVSGVPSASTQLSWRPDLDSFLFIDTDLNPHGPTQVNGSVVIGTAGSCTTTTFSNPGPIVIPGAGSSGIAAPYPSTISVSGMSGPLTNLFVNLTGIIHGHPKDIDALLVGPQGQNAIIMSDAGGYGPVSGVSVGLTDAFAYPSFFDYVNPLPNGGPLFNGVYHPTNIVDCDDAAGDAFPAPAPIPAGGSALSVFTGTDPNGTWSLYVVDDHEDNTGSLGWSVTIQTGTCPSPSPQPSPSPTAGPTHFQVDVPNNVAAGVPFQFIVTPLDRFGSSISYPGTVHFTSSDPTAVLPPDAVGGTTFTATLNQVSTRQTITATAVQHPRITGTSSCVLVQVPTPSPTPCDSCTPTPTPSPTPTPTPTPTASPATPTPTPGCLSTITQSTSLTITAGTSISCNGGSPNFFHADNSYWRAFDVSAVTVGVSYTVTGVDYGIETATANPAIGTQPITVRLYLQTSGVFPGGARTQIATVTQNLPNQSGTVHTVPIIATVPPGTTQLIMEVFTPNGQSPVNNSFFIGSNTAPQTGPSYISAATCGLTTPTDVSTIGFPNMHIVFNVRGACPDPTPPITPTPTPAQPCGTFSNSSTITIPGSQNGGVAAPYPSNIAVSGLGGAITKVNVAINGINHTHPKDLDLLLVGPNGQNAIIMSDVGGFSSVSGINLVLDDAVPDPLPNWIPLVNGTFRPTNIGECGVGPNPSAVDSFPVPAPSPPVSGAAALAVFNGTNPNGTWSLYVVDDTDSFGGSFASGWSLIISTTGCVGPTATPMPTPTPGGATHFAVNVKDLVTEGFPFFIQVAARDEQNHTVSNYPGTIHFTSSDPEAILPNDSPLIDGTGTFVGRFGFFRIGTSQTITVTDVVNPSIAGTSNCILVISEHSPTPTPPIIPTPTPCPACTPTPTPTPGEAHEAHAQNLSTRLFVRTGEEVGVGGFIITGSDPKRLLLRGIGPSLGSIGVSNLLVDPVLELHGSIGSLYLTNNNWRETQEAEIIATGIAPVDDLESAILITLEAGSYTAILKGNSEGVGIGLVEIFDLSQGSASKLVNLSTRAFVSTGSDIVIAGFILGGGTNDDTVLLRGLGPSLIASGVSNALANPTLELRNSEGAVIAMNDDWQSGPTVSLPPGDPLESAIETALSPGAYTALLSGVNNGTGVGLIEVYDRGTP